MKTIKSVTLVLKRRRERVYVAELVELVRDTPDRFLVNYRYGSAGAELTEGTRTADPVGLQSAEDILQSLVIAREAQGYTRTDEQAPWDSKTEVGPSPVTDTTTDPRSARLLYLLERIDAMPDHAASKLLWRIGQVRLADALPDLLQLRHHAGHVTRRGLVYALSRCGSDRPHEVWPALRAMSADADAVVAEQAKIARVFLDDPQADVASLIDDLPRDVAEALVDEPAAAVQRLLGFLMAAADEANMRRIPSDSDYGATQQQALMNLYLIAHKAPQVREVFLELLRVTPLTAFLFRATRRIYKAAEAFDDAAVFGCLSQRFEDVEGTYTRGYQSKTELARSQSSPQSRRAWSHATRRYFRRRVWRQLRRLGSMKDPSFIPLAAACLMEAPKEPDIGRVANPSGFVFHSILHSAGNRMMASQSLNWSFGYRRAVAATQREEPFGKLWDAAPDTVLQLLLNAPSFTVHEFAIRILKDNPRFCEGIAAADIARLLESKGLAANSFALSLARAKISLGPEEARILIPALFASQSTDAHELGQTALSFKPEIATQDSAFAARLILGVSKATNAWLDDFFGKHAATSDVSDVAQQVVARALDPSVPMPADKTRARLVAGLLANHFRTSIQSLAGDDLKKLAEHEDVALNILSVLLAAERSDGILQFDPAQLAQHDDPDMQSAAAKLLAQAAPQDLLGREELVMEFLRSPVPDARQAAVTAIGRIAVLDIEAADRLAVGLTTILFRREQEVGARDSAVAAALQEPIMASFVRQGPEQIWKMLRAKAEPARRIGATALQHFDAQDMSLRKIARIGTNDQRIAREWSLKALTERLDEVAAHPEEIFALLDGAWDDSREAAYDLIRNKLDPGDWQPETIVALCDCTTKPAEAFGREMLMRAFSEDNAGLFLRRLSEHPSGSFRLTIARLIREYAGDDPKKLRDVEPALRTLLSRVFSSRPAKEQGLSYIREEIARGNPESLPIVADLLERLSATCAVGDRGMILELIVKLKDHDPTLVPMAKVIAPEVRGVGVQ